MRMMMGMKVVVRMMSAHMTDECRWMHVRVTLGN